MVDPKLLSEMPDGTKVSMEDAEKILEVYAEWCAERDTNLEQGAMSVPIPVAEMYIIRLLCAFKKIPRVIIDIPCGKH